MRLIYVAIALSLATTAFADTIILRSGRVMNGTYLGGTARSVKVEVGDHIETLEVSDIARIEFGGLGDATSQNDHRPVLHRSDNSAASDDRPILHRSDDSAATPDDRPTLRRSDDSATTSDDRPILRRNDDGAGGVILRPDPSDTGTPPPAAPRAPIDLAAGTNIVVRMIDGVDSDTAHVGQTFAASLDQPVMSPSGGVLIPRGTDALVKLVDSKESGRLTGRAELTLDLASVKVDGRMVDINTQTVSRVSDARGQQTAKVAGGTAAVGAIIGAVAGGGKGAVIGGAAGGAAGAGVEAITKGQRVRVPSETRLTFVLDSPVRI